MSVTIYKKAGEPFDIIAAGGYMIAGFHDATLPPIDRNGKQFGQYYFLPTADNRIRQIGARKPGFNSAGAKVLELVAPAYLRFAGTFQLATDPTAPILVLFDSFYSPDEPQHLLAPEYTRSFVAFYDLSPDSFMFVTPAQASRIVSKDFILY